LPFGGTSDDTAEEPTLGEDPLQARGVVKEIAIADPEAPEIKLRKLATNPIPEDDVIIGEDIDT